MNETLSQAAIGRVLDLSPALMTKLKKQGCPMDSVEAVRAWRQARQNIAARKPEPAPPPALNTPRFNRVGGDDFAAMIRATKVELSGLDVDESHDEARTRREIAEASMAEMKEAEMRGKFLKKSEVDSAIFEIARALRDGLTNCARRIAADVAALGSAEDCEAVIDREHRALLDSMTHRISSKLGANMANAAA